MAVGKTIAALVAAGILAMTYHSTLAGDEPAAPPVAQLSFAVGDVLPQDSVHYVARPGLYGLGDEPVGSIYAVAYGHLIRFDPQTMRVLSILRSQDRILD